MTKLVFCIVFCRSLLCFYPSSVYQLSDYGSWVGKLSVDVSWICVNVTMVLAADHIYREYLSNYIQMTISWDDYKVCLLLLYQYIFTQCYPTEWKCCMCRCRCTCTRFSEYDQAGPCSSSLISACLVIKHPLHSSHN
jgi:hypothetical protein